MMNLLYRACIMLYDGSCSQNLFMEGPGVTANKNKSGRRVEIILLQIK